MKPNVKELAPATEPDIEKLREEFHWAVQKRDSNIFRRQRLNYDTRYCRWAHQSEDGRKWSAPKGEEIFPFRGAFDSRVPLIDLYINEDVAKLMVIWRRMRIQVSGVESNDTDFAVRLTQVLRWMKYTQMTESRREMRLLANLFLERGAAVLGVFWDKQSQLGYDTADLETIQGIAMEAQQAGPQPLVPGLDNEQLIQLPFQIIDPTQEDAAIAVGQILYPDLKVPRLRRIVKDLRETGTARFPRPYLIRNRPCLLALALNEELFAAPETTDLRTAPTLDRLEAVSETTLRERIQTLEWDVKWVEEVIATQRGRFSTDYQSLLARRNSRDATRNTSKLFEIIHSYRRRGDDEGVPGIYYTCWSAGLTTAHGYHALLNYDHGEYPFTLFERETRSRLIDDSRGYGEIGSTWQDAKKVEWDSRRDRASITTMPPFHHPPGEPPDKWGPGVRLGTNRPEGYGFFATPKYDRGSEEIEATVEKFASRYFGRVVGEENLAESLALNQELAENWMAGDAAASTQVLQLMQQFMPEHFYYRVVGSSKAKTIRASREEIQGAFDVQIGFSVTDLDPAQLKPKFELIREAINLDTEGVIDRSELLAVIFELIDPNLGERLLKPAAEAAQAEIDDEQTVYAKLFAGIGVDVRPGQGYQLRLQTLRNIMQTNKLAQQRYQQDEQFRQLIDTRLQQLAFQLQQKGPNARAGRQGAKSLAPEALAREAQSRLGAMPA